MKKNKALKIILTAIFICLIALTVAFYVFDIVKNDSPPSKNIFRTLALIFALLAGIVRVQAIGGKRRSLDYYKVQYAEQLGSAFEDSFLNQKKLLCAIRLYNEGNNTKALKYLSQLKPICNTRDDVYAVGLFIALTLTDMRLENEAAEIYKQMISMNVVSTTVYGNLGHIYASLGNYDDATSYLRLAIESDEKNPVPYSNLAKMYFDTYDFENAKNYALDALEINHKFRQPATLLAIIYSLENDIPNADKYSLIATSNGETPERLKSAIERYKAAMSEKDESDNEDSDD